MKIDVFTHVLPRAYHERMLALSGRTGYMQKRVREIPVLTDVELRFRMMDQFPHYQQVLTLSTPPPEAVGDSKATPELVRIANDGMADMVEKHPDRFVAFAASLPMDDMDACMVELERAVT